MSVEVEIALVPSTWDESMAVLLQLPHGYVMLRPEDAREVARNLTLAAEEAQAASP